MLQQIIKGLLSGITWTVGKAVAEDGVKVIRKKVKERQEKTEGEEGSLEDIEVAPDKDDKDE